MNDLFYFLSSWDVVPRGRLGPAAVSAMRGSESYTTPCFWLGIDGDTDANT